MSARCPTAILRLDRPALVGSLILLLAIPSGADAQTRGATVTVPSDVTFSTSGQSLWGPGSGGSADASLFSIFDTGWNTGPQGASDFASPFFGFKFGGSITAQSNGRVASGLALSGFGSGSVGVTYPIRVTFTFPEPNSFTPGEPVTIQTAWSLLPGWHASTGDPAFTIGLDGAFAFGFGVTGEVCVFTCTGNFDIVPAINVPDDTQRLLTISPSSVSLAGLDVLPLPFSAGVKKRGVSGTISAPRLSAALSRSGDVLVLTGNNQFFDLDVDLDQLLTAATIKVPLGASVPFGVGTLTYETVDLSSTFDLFNHLESRFEASPVARISFPTAVQWFSTSPAGVQTPVTTSSVATFPLGHSLTVIFPAGRRDPLPSSPSFDLDNTFSTRAGVRFTSGLITTVGKTSGNMAATPFSTTVKEERIHFECKVAQVVCDVTAFVVESVWKKVVELVDVLKSTTFRAISFSVGPLVGPETLASVDETVDYFPTSSWELGGFNHPSAPRFLLDPEDPRIGLESSVANSLLATGADPGTVTETLTLTNLGDVNLSAVQILEAITAEAADAGYSVVRVTGLGLTPGPFDGAADQTVLDGFDALGVGQSAKVFVVLALTPGRVFNKAVTAEGTSPIGTSVDATTSDRFGLYPMLIKEHRLDRKHDGRDNKRVRVRVFTTPDLDAHRIDVPSVRLEGAAPTRSRFHDGEDEGDEGLFDGLPYLELEFPQTAVLAGLDARMGGGGGALALVADLEAARAQGQQGLTPMPEEDLVAVLMRPRSLSPEELRSVDRFGNGNGRVDLGDLRARSHPAATWTTVSVAANAKGDGGSSGPPPADTEILVLSGTLDDGTPFWAEDDVEIREER